ncbi:MAG: BTAD domain-containing putative transcriptional regulator [Gemmatimonadaceae bacterium]
MESHQVRIHLAGRVSLEVCGQLFDQPEFPGQQGRVAFAYLAAERGRPVERTELADALWPSEVPSSSDTALNAVMSKLRALLVRAKLSSGALTGGAGYYELHLPESTWLDLEAAADAIHEAETAIRVGDPGRAYGPSAVAHHIARRPFLPGWRGSWIESRRNRLRNVLLRALECRGEVYLWNHEYSLAVEAAHELMGLEPLRESGHRLLIRSLAAAGNTAEALWAYEKCRRLIAREIGVAPSKETKAVYDAVLGACS